MRICGDREGMRIIPIQKAILIQRPDSAILFLEYLRFYEAYYFRIADIFSPRSWGVGQAGAGANLLGGKGMEIWPTRGNEQTETMDQIVPPTSFFEAKMAGKV